MWKKFKKSMWYPVAVLAVLAGMVYGLYMVITGSSSTTTTPKVTEDESDGFIDRAKDWWAQVGATSEEGGSLFEEAATVVSDQAQAVKTWLGWA